LIFLGAPLELTKFSFARCTFPHPSISDFVSLTHLSGASMMNVKEFYT
jgi:hypothetical protein